MATYRVDGPDGSHYQIEGPDSADPSAVIAQVTGQHTSVAPNAPVSSQPHAMMSGAATSPFVRFLAGIGLSEETMAKGLGQRLGILSTEQANAHNPADALLSDTTSGKAGQIAGQILPFAVAPGAGTLAGAAGYGALSGALQPTQNPGQTATNTLVGGAAGIGGLLGGRVIGAAAKGLYAAGQPLFAAGQKAIAAKTLQAAAGGERAAQTAAQAIDANSANILPGIQPTTAELADNAGLAQLERTLKNNPQYLPAFAERAQTNRGAMTGALKGIAGTDADLAAAQATRDSIAAPLYNKARGASVESNPDLQDLLGRPSMQAAWKRAQQLASERGDSLVIGKDIPEQTVNSALLDESGKPFSTTIPGETAQYSGKAIQYLKMGLNDIADTGEQRGTGAHEKGALNQTQATLGKWIQSNVPALKTADTAYAQSSVPINQMEVGQALTNKLLPPLSDLGNSTRLNSNNYANAVRNGDQLASSVTGNPNSTLQSVLSPDQWQTVTQVGQQLARRANADEAGRAVGSNTAQNLISQNITRSLLGPLGFSPSTINAGAQSTLFQTALRPLQFVGKFGEQRIMDQLTEASLDPVLAKRLLASGLSPSVVQKIMNTAGKTLGGSQGLIGASSAAAGQSVVQPQQ